MRALLLILAIALVATARSYAQSAYFSGVTTTVGSGFTEPADVAVDKSGDVFVAETLNSAVYEIEAGTGGTAAGLVSASSTVVTVGSGFNAPAGLAVDENGNVFITDAGNNAVYEIEAGTGGNAAGKVSSTSTVVAVGSGFSNPTGVALDGSGDIFVADSGNNAVKEVPSGCVTSSCIVAVGSGFSSPEGLAVNSAGDVFVTQNGNSAVYEIEAGTGGNAAGQVSSTSTIVAISSGLNTPKGLAVDGSGDVFVTDFGNNAVDEIEAGTGGNAAGQVSTSSTVVTLGSGFSEPSGVAVDSNGDAFVGDFGNNAVKEIETQGVNIGSTEVNTTTPMTQTLTFTFTAAGTIEAPAVLTQGAASLDFKNAGTGACASGTSYAVGSSCTVNITFAPALAGTRNGAVVLSNSSGTPIATAYVYGTGTGPQIVFSPPTQSIAVGSALNDPYRVAVDGNGNLYVADYGNNEVHKYAPNGSGSYTLVGNIGSGLNSPGGVTVDGGGNVYIADYGNNEVHKYAPNGSGSYTLVENIGSGLSFPDDVAVDGSGNVYIADTFNNAVHKYTPNSSGGYTQVGDVGSGLSFPNGVTVDGSGNVYIADTSNNAVKKYAPNGSGGYTLANNLNSGFSSPTDVAVDGAGNLYIADDGHSMIDKYVPNGSGGYTLSPLTVGSGLTHPVGVTSDGSGNVYIADSVNNRVLKEDYADAPSLTFSSTTVGASPEQTLVTLANNGNADLSFPAPTTGLNPSVAANFSYDASSTCPQLDTSSSAYTLAPGLSCALVLDFAPTVAGSIIGSAVITDNSLNANPSTTQTLNLSGTATGLATQTITFPALATSVTYGAGPVSLAATASSSLAVNYTVTGPAIVSGSTLSFTGTGTVVVTATQTGNATYQAATPVSQTITVAQATLTVTAANASRAYGTANPAFTGTVTGAVNGDTFTVSGTTTATTASGVGSYAITPTATGANLADYAVTYVNATLTVTQATLTVTATDATRFYGAANPTFTGTITGAVNGDTFTVSGTTAATPASGVGSYSITPTATGANLADYTVTYVNGKLAVAPATLVVAAASVSRLYGAANPTFAAGSFGAVNGDTFTTTATTTATTASAVGTYAITPTVTGANLADYTVSPVNGTLTVTPAPLTVTAANVTRTYGGANPTFTGTYSGAVNGDSFTVTGTTTATATSAPGTYPIVPVATGANLNDYSVTYVNGVLTVTSKPSFSISASASTLNISEGGSAHTVITVTPENGFSGSITFSCEDLPVYTRCLFGAQSVQVSNGQSGQIEMYVNAGQVSRLISPTQPGSRNPFSPALAGVFFWWPGGLAGLAAFGRKRKLTAKQRRWMHLCLLLLVTGALAAGISGCIPETITGSAPTGTSQFTVVGSAATSNGTVVATTTITMNVSN